MDLINNINFILPNFTSYGRNEIILNICAIYPFVCREHFKIYSFYGTFPNTIFNGGRVIVGPKNTDINEMKSVAKFYKKKGVRITFTFTNQCLEEKHLYDKYCNQILRIFHDEFNEILVTSPILEKYIRGKYPKYKINKSITATIMDGSDDSTNYNLLVIDKKNNRNFRYLSCLENKDKIEILCDETCVNDCDCASEHYNEISLFNIGVDSTEPYFTRCKYYDRFTDYSFIKTRNDTSIFYVNYDDIKKKYVPMGFKYFKLSGREKYNYIGTESILSYLFKDEYLNDVATYIYERIFFELEEEGENVWY